MTIDEKIKQGSAVCKQDKFNIGNDSVDTMLLGNREWGFIAGANFLKSEMLADMQKLAEALERAIKPDVEYESLIAKEIVEKALAEFNAKYKGEK